MEALTRIESIAALLESIAELPGELGDRAAQLQSMPSPVATDDPVEWFSDVEKWLWQIEMCAWRAQSDPVLRQSCDAILDNAPLIRSGFMQLVRSITAKHLTAGQ